jgi:hypothetical protein
MELLFFLQVGGLSDYLNAIAVLGGLGAILGIMMAIVDATICNYGECNILINKDQKKK